MGIYRCEKASFCVKVQLKVWLLSTPKQVTIFADGACIPNPGPGGWAILLQFADVTAEMVGAEPRSTNLRMEIMAVVQGLECLKEPCDVHLVSDSDYVCDGIGKWLSRWKAHGWKSSGGDPVKHIDLWTRLDDLLAIHRIQVLRPETKVDLKLNARVDALANDAAIRQVKSRLTYVKMSD